LTLPTDGDDNAVVVFEDTGFAMPGKCSAGGTF